MASEELKIDARRSKIIEILNKRTCTVYSSVKT